MLYSIAPCGFNASATNNPRPLNSPNWPESLDDQHFCTWRIAAEPGQIILLNFSYFAIGDHNRIEVRATQNFSTLIF